MNKKDNTKKTEKKIIPRPPVVVIMGHVDHGKSTLLDYIRKSNVVEKEAGGITQHISAYEVNHKDEGPSLTPPYKQEKKITFLDTPGHEAFSKMRERGAKVADIAILVVSAEDAVQSQTIEAWKVILANNIPCIVAINKIDKPNANIEKTKINLAENEIYLENFGGKIPCAEISAKIGTGVDNLLSLILLLAEMENFTGNINEAASGFVIEASLDTKRGIQATLIIKNGFLKNGNIIVAGDAFCSVRIMENFLGKSIKEASFSSPVRIVGFNKMPNIGSEFICFEKKSEAEEFIKNIKENKSSSLNPQSPSLPPLGSKPLTGLTPQNSEIKKIIPIILKVDVAGSLEAIEKEILKIKNHNTQFKIIQKGAGPISESDLKNITSSKDVLVIGFNVKADKNAAELAEIKGIKIYFFDIIYKLTEWLSAEMEERKLKTKTVEIIGRAKIIKIFSCVKDRQIVGGKVISGKINLGVNVKIIRREFEIGQGKIVNLEKSKTKISEIDEGNEFGMMLESKIELTAGDIIEAFSIVEK